ncbi:hypothetical protein GCM10008013_12410 [Paenibacillus segetis]|uniref:Uncharacterized protein n=1 Tax=Paenibacillus segetis TaxID=1325360 RepID=A0ABQ1Y9C1_9BACL|nr:hypothetical protein GCM10008013_12410 [Paenibacillus segetis]
MIIVFDVITESEKVVQSQNWVWSWDLVIKAIGLVAIVATFITSLVGASKYFFEKNRDVHLRRLNEVYAPLYTYLVKQESFRKIMMPDAKIKDFPIITLINVKSTQRLNIKAGEPITFTNSESEEVLSILDRNNFIKLFDKTNKGLARPKLLLLLNQYEMLIYLEESLPHEKDRDSDGRRDDGYFEDDDPKWILATKEKVEVENEIFNEIISGYLETLTKLEIDKKSSFETIKNFFKEAP